MGDEIIDIYEKAEEISEIVDKLKKISFEDLVKTKHFYYSIDEKGTDFEFIKKIFSQFERIKLITKRKHKNQKISYDFYYLLDNDSYILYAISLDGKPTLLNSYHVQKSLKHFRQSLGRYYKNKFS